MKGEMCEREDGEIEKGRGGGAMWRGGWKSQWGQGERMKADGRKRCGWGEERERE